MSKMTSIRIILLITLTLPLLIIFTGCPQHIDTQYGINVVSDGSGGAFALYQDRLGGNVYIQKISPDGSLLWGEKGVLLGKNETPSYTYHYAYIISDGSGGAIASWFGDIYHVVKLDAGGNIAWQKDFGRVVQLVSDGSGGVIADTSPDENSIVLTRIDSGGNLPWGTTVSMPYPGYGHRVTDDGSGGAIIIYERLRYPEGAQPGETHSRGYIYIQKIDSEGQLSWGEEGSLIYSTPVNAYAESLQIVNDGTGGAIAAWQQLPSVKIESGSPEALLMDVIVQKIDTGGKTVWKEGGLPLEISKAVANVFPIMEPLLVNDGQGGAVITWRDTRDRSSGSEASLYAQRVNKDGNFLWQAGGVKVSSTSLNPHHAIASDGSGGALITYSFPGDWKMLRMQKLGNNGNALWGENGVLVFDGKYSGYSVSPDGLGGVVIGWGVSKGRVGSEEAYIQRVSADGTLLWGAGGIKLNP
jgi:hypothetical protein